MDAGTIAVWIWLGCGFSMVTILGWKEQFQAMQDGFNEADPHAQVPVAFRVIIIMGLYAWAILLWPAVIYLLVKEAKNENKE